MCTRDPPFGWNLERPGCSPAFIRGECVDPFARGEIVMIDDAPSRTPGTGGASALCSDHMVGYERRARPYRCCAHNCVLRGPPVDLKDRHIPTRSANLKDQRGEVTGGRLSSTPSTTALPTARQLRNLPWRLRVAFCKSYLSTLFLAIKQREISSKR